MLESLLMKNNVDSGDYAEFDAWITSQNFPVTPTTGAMVLNARSVCSSPGFFSGTMWGSPYGAYFTTDSTVNRIYQHAFPTQALLDENIASNRRVVFNCHSVGGQVTSSLTRNGYTSSFYQVFACAYMSEFIYWDEQLKKARIYDPWSMSAPKDFVF